MKRHILAILLLLGLLSQPAQAGGDFFMVSDVGSSARMIRMGNIEGFSEFANGVFENPASLYRTKRFSASVFTTTFMNEVQYKNLSVSTKLPFGTLGLGYMTAGVGAIPRTYESVATTPGEESTFDVGGYFDYNNTMAKVSYELSQTENLHFGTSLTYYASTIDTHSGRGFNFDAGIVAVARPLTLSVVAKNVVPSLKVNYSNGQSETLPLQTSYSALYHIGNFDLLGQLRAIGNNQKFMKSFAVNYSPHFVPFFHISGGYKEFPVIRDIKSNYVLGLGLDVFDVSFDYAYERSEHIEYNNKHYFSVAFSY